VIPAFVGCARRPRVGRAKKSGKSSRGYCQDSASERERILLTPCWFFDFMAWNLCARSAARSFPDVGVGTRTGGKDAR
jgi:hypothetical protein